MTGIRCTVAAILMLALIALGLSLWLTRHALLAGPIAGCTDSALVACDEVLGSRWATWFGIPVSVFGVITYGLLVGAAARLLVCPDNDGWAAKILIPTAVAAGSAALWFTGVQLFWLHKFCPYCMATHGCGLIVASLVIVRQWLVQARRIPSVAANDLRSALGIVTLSPPVQESRPQRSRHVGLISLGLGAFACLVVGQLVYRPKQLFVTELEAAGGAYQASEIASPLAEEAPSVTLSGGANKNNPPNLTVEVGDDHSMRRSADSTAPALPPAQRNSGGEGRARGGKYLSAARLNETARNPVELEGQSLSVVGAAVPIVTLQGEPPLQREDVILLGNADADFVLVELLDYTCAACRRMHSRLEAVRHELDDRLAVALLPIAMERRCNPIMVRDRASHRNACKLARLSLAVWQTAPDRFEELHEWLMQTESYQDFTTVWEFASDLVDTDQLITAVSSERIEAQLARNVHYWDLLGRSLPTLVAGNKVIQGQVESDAELIELIRGQMVLHQAP